MPSQSTPPVHSTLWTPPSADVAIDPRGSSVVERSAMQCCACVRASSLFAAGFEDDVGYYANEDVNDDASNPCE
jgi:hypothetical protein